MNSARFTNILLSDMDVKAGSLTDERAATKVLVTSRLLLIEAACKVSMLQ